MSKHFAAILILAGFVCLAAGADVPFIFQPNTPAKSSEVNADFADVNAKAISAQATATAAQATATTAQNTATAAATAAQAAQNSVNTLSTTVTAINGRVGALEAATPNAAVELISPTTIALTYTKQILAPGALVTIGGKQYKMACFPVVNYQNMNKFKIYIPVINDASSAYYSQAIEVESCSRTAKAAPIIIDGHDADYKMDSVPRIGFSSMSLATAYIGWSPKIQVTIMLNSSTAVTVYCMNLCLYSVTIPVDANLDSTSGANFAAINATYTGMVGNAQSIFNQYIGLIRVETVP